ncbi:hypothetical protein Lfu02_09840 [Longispora fulva]|uniref:Uncharacterized protein n=1 Tax=Longispora fulva TaxID=619741 RepID=A0A8J7G7J7_9ACTN|nr:hypothetical protein [Longispora fulva]MBG6135153.1 hypothetical protein [Longispora fulva]GIG56612.1 hypothetical protein Lfu02_09840 [Longispora fulva]
MHPSRLLLPVGVVLALAAALSPATTAQAQSPSACAFTPSNATGGEAAPSCVAADVALDRLPAVGESAALRIRLRSQVPVDAARLAVRLSPTLTLATGAGLSAPRRVGLDQVAERTFTLPTRGRTLTLRVTAVAPGPAQIQADVTDAAHPDQERSAHATTVFTVGDRAGGSHAGLVGTDSAAVTVDARPAANGHALPLAPPTAALAGQICAKGQFTFTDKTGTWLAGRNIPVAVTGKSTSSGNAQTWASGLTGTDGRYSLCFTSPVTQMASLQVRFTSDSSLWRVTDNAGSAAYTVTTAAKSNVPAGDADFGTTSPGSTQMRGWHAFDTLNLLWGIRASGTNCWTARETGNCSRITIHWQPGSTDGTYFSPSGKYVALMDADPDSEHLVLHESGHHFMDLLYAGWWPSSDCPSPHYLHKRSGPSCAWTEGFANAIAGYTKGDGMFYWPNGAFIDMMTTTPFDPSQPASRTNVEDGDQVECRVAGSLIDLWRQVDGGPAGTFANMRQYRSSSFREEFNDDRPLTGLSTTAATRDLVWTHTIDYRLAPPGGPLANGGFESGTANWTITGGVVTNSTTYPAQTGSWYARMGGNGTTNTDTLSQSFAVPTGASATLGYYLRIVTQETEPTVYDTLKVQVVDGTTTTTLATWSNTNPSTGYVYRTVDLGNYRGRTVTLKFVSVEDASLRTDFLIDTLTVTTT